MWCAAATPAGEAELANTPIFQQPLGKTLLIFVDEEIFTSTFD